MSVRLSTARPRACSGLMYAGVPRIRPVRVAIAVVCAFARRRLRRSRDAEVEHLHRAVCRDLDVGGFEIAMHDAALVCRLERRRRSAAQSSALPMSVWSTRAPLGQRRPFDELEHKCADALGVLEAVNRGDVGMIERGEHAGFALEARPELRVERELPGSTTSTRLGGAGEIRRAVHCPMPPTPRRPSTRYAPNMTPGESDGRTARVAAASPRLPDSAASRLWTSARSEASPAHASSRYARWPSGSRARAA